MNEFYLSTEFAVVDSKVPLNQQIYKFLKKAIIECQLMPDDPVSENAVASKFRFKISRQPVREALIKLAENGFVLIEPKKTTKVSRISKSEILQGSEIRKALECHIVQLACDKITDETLQQLENNVTSQRFVAEQYKLHDHFALDDEFHQLIVKSAGVDKAWDIIEGVKGTMDRVRFLSLEYELTPMILTSNAHSKIYDALKAHDKAACVAAMEEHIAETKISLEQVIKKCKPEWFQP
ncbi:MAG: GntR family transcriptional regulator [Succinivibrio sp.]|nr:GntR family transcriptional regulator [Succinivibrio sp.]